MAYVDGYVIPVPKKKVAAYRKMAQKGAKVWLEHGALEVRECIGDDLAVKWGKRFPQAMRLKPSETVVFSWIVYKSKADRNRVTRKVISDPRMNEFELKDMPFEMKRMVFGGFKVIV